MKQSGLKSENIALLEGMVQAGQLKFDAARAAYIEALRQYPGSLRARFNLARLASMLGRNAEMEQYLIEILKQEPANEQALSLLVSVYVADGRLAQAVVVAEAGRNAAPTNAALTAMLADLYSRSNQPKRALDLVEAALKDQTLARPLIVARARAQVALGLLREAQDGFRLMLAADPNDTAARRALVEIMLRNNSADTARALLRDGLAATPGNPALLQTLVGVDLHEGGPERALATLAELQRDSRNVTGTRGLKGDILLSTNRFAEAAQAYGEDLAEGATSDLVMRTVGALNAGGRPGDATRLLYTWTEKTPDDLNARVALISNEIGAKHYDEAEKLLVDLLEKQPGNPIALNNLAWLYHLKNDPRARPAAQRAWLLAPTAQVADTYGWILTGQGEAASALPLLRQAARELPTELAVQYHLAVALSEAGLPDEATSVLRPLIGPNTSFDEKPDAVRLMEKLGRR